MSNQWRSEKIITSSSDFAAELVMCIQNAQRNIEIESYIFLHDELGQKILKELKTAVDRGVKVRVIVDGVGSPQWLNHTANLDAQGILSRVYNPMPFPFQWAMLKEAHNFNLTLKLFSLINQRNHKKVFLFDSKIALIGSMNIMQPSLYWHETSIRIEGEDLKYLLGAFEFAWEKSYTAIKPNDKEKPAIDYDASVKSNLINLNFTRLLRKKAHAEFLDRILTSQESIWTTQAYFVPPLTLLRKIFLVARRGIDIKIIVPAKSDVPFVRWITFFYYKRLLKHGVKIYEYLPKILHSKIIIVDNWAQLGSSNLNHRSYNLNLEVDVMSENPNTIKKLRELFQENLLESKEITLAELPKKNIVVWIKNIFAKIFKEQV